MRAGIDDFGSGPYRGFSCVIIGEAGTAGLERRSREILGDHSLAEFHGKDFRMRHADAYESFLTEVRTALDRHGEYAAFQLIHTDLYQQLFEADTSRLAVEVLQSLGTEATNFIMEKTGWLCSFARDLGEIPHDSGTTVAVAMDWKQESDQEAADVPRAISGNLGALLTSSADVVVRLANAYKKRKFPCGPSIASLSVCDSKDSILVQAADVIANLGVNFVKSRVRTECSSSPPEREKARIFAGFMPEAESDLPDPLDLSVTCANTLDGAADTHLRLQILSSAS